MAAVQDLAIRIAGQGGAALIIDYGNDGAVASSLVGIRRHEYVSPLAFPGEADLSAHVDFAALRRTVEDVNKRLPSGTVGVVAYPLVRQRELLRELGLGPYVEDMLETLEKRKRKLLADAAGKSEEERLKAAAGAQELEQQQQALLAVFHRLVGLEDGQMGGVYKAFCIARKDMETPVGFDTISALESQLDSSNAPAEASKAPAA